MTVLYRFPVKGLGNAAFSYPLSCSTLVLGDRSLAAVTPCTPFVGQECVGGLGISLPGKLVGHPRGTIPVEVAL